MAVLAFLAAASLPKRLCRLYLIWKKHTVQRVKIRHFSTSYRTYKLIMSDDPAPYILQSALQNIMAAQKSISNGMS